MIEIDVGDIDDLTLGAAFLGTGGGGDPYIGGLMTKRALREHGPVKLIDPDETPDDWLVFVTGNLGAPTVLIERMMSTEQSVDPVRALQRYLGRKVDALIAFEAGGSNSVMPIYAAAKLGLPVIDGDGMGRAFPEMHMETFSVYGVSASPFAIADERGNTAVMEVKDDKRAEWYARGLSIRMGARSAIASYPMSGRDAKRTAVPRTASLCMKIGRTIRQARAASRDPFAALIEMLAGTHYQHAKVLFQGKITDVRRETRQGWAIGHFTVAGIGDHDGALEVNFQNENLVARQNGRVRAIVPDLICVLDTELAVPITTERLRYGQRVTVMGVAAPPIMRTPEALAVFGPVGFNIDEPFTPIEALA